MLKLRFIHFLFLTLCVLFYSGCSKDPVIEKYKTKFVIVLVVDGARYTETWGNPTYQFIPKRAGLLNEGVMCTHFYNNGYTFTNAGHTAMTTGVYQNIDNSGGEYPINPSIFQYWLNFSKQSSEDAWVIATKDKLAILSDCTDAAWHGQYRPSTDCGVNGLATGYREDSTTFNHLKIILASYHPHLVLVNFKQPDAAGHSGDSLAYLQGIMDTDNYIYQAWRQIQSDDLMKNQTTMIVTNDHGRHTAGHLDGFISHTDGCDGCRHIEFFAIGPDFKENYFSTTNYDQNDIATTIAELMGFKMPTSQGKIIQDIFK